MTSAVTDMVQKQNAAAAANKAASSPLYTMGPTGKLVKAEAAPVSAVKTTQKRNKDVMFKTEPANCENCNLYQVSFVSQGKELYKAELRGADLRDANLAGANLHGADLTGEKMIL